MEHTHGQEICETNETDVYKPRMPWSICPIAVQCHLKQYPPCNMIMVAWRDEAAHGMISEATLKRYEAKYRGE